MKNKNISVLMRTTALTAVTLVAINNNTARAEDFTLPVNGQVVAGASTITTPSIGNLHVNQHTERTVINWDSFNIGENATVQFYQPSSSSLAVNRVVGLGQDPTRIMGTLRANGNIMVLDRNGVLFGKNSIIDVGGIVASTGDVDVQSIMNGQSKINLNNIATGEVINEGNITVSDYGMASFVAPSVKNSGVINAKLGKVELAAGTGTATIDLYGDGLVEFAPNGNAGAVLAENSGAINAENGVVNITASAAKNVVDNVVNMSGVVNASSVSVVGGKIVLSGSVNASGKNGGGKINVKASDITSTQTAKYDASATENGNGGVVNLIATNANQFNGTIIARGAGTGNGGEVEVSGALLGFNGNVDLGSDAGAIGNLLLDPTFVVIHSGVFDVPSYIISAQQLANAMKAANVTVMATDFIDVGTKETVYNINTGDPVNDAILNATLNGLDDGDIDVSTWNVGGTGTTAGSLTLQSALVNFNRNLLIGNGNVTVDAATINLDGKISGKVAGIDTILNASRMSSNSSVVNVISNDALIAQGLDLIATNGTVNVGAGTYAEDLVIAKNGITLNGNRAGVAGYDASRGINETIITPTSSAIVVTANNATIDGLTIDGASNGVEVSGANNATIKNNIIKNSTNHAVYATGSAHVLLESNLINTTGNHAVYLHNSANATVTDNQIGVIGTNNNINGDGILLNLSNGAEITENTITETTSTAAKIGNGVHVLNSNNVLVDGNTISNSEWDGVKVTAGNVVTVSNNDIDNVVRVGVYSEKTKNMVITDNDIDNAKMYGVKVTDTNNALIAGNEIDTVGIDGILSYFANGTSIVANIIGYGDDNTLNTADDTKIKQNGIYVLYSANNGVFGNAVANTGNHGIAVEAKSNVYLHGNSIDFTGRNGINLKQTTNALVENNLIGQIGINNNINGDGILVDRSHGAIIDTNYITETTMTADKIGNGVHVLNSDNVSVANNEISNAQWDGVKITNGTNVSVDSNAIDNVVRVGVYSEYTKNMDITNNDINIAHMYGVEVKDTTDALISGNEIDNVDIYGIFNYFAPNTIITDNIIGYGDDNVLNTADDSVIKKHGIAVIYSNNVNVESNGVAHTGLDGIYVQGKTNNIINSNYIDFTGRNGVQLDKTTNNQVINNFIGTIGINNNINGEGVLVNKSNGSLVRGNTITETTKTAPEIGSGVHAVDSFNITIDKNDISNAEWDAVKITNGGNVYVTNNKGYNLVRTGVFSNHTNGITIDGNDIDVAGKYGIEVKDTKGAIINNNTVDAIGIDGILAYFSGGAQITNNTIGYGIDGILNTADDTKIKQDGIGIRYSGGTVATGNNIANTKRDGVYVQGKSDITVDANTINLAGRHGVYLDGAYGALSVSGNEIYDTGFNGIFAYNNNSDRPLNLQILNNVIENPVISTGYAGIGIDVSQSGYVNIAGNVIGQNFDYGLLGYSGLIDLTGVTNKIYNTDIGMGFYAGGEGISPSSEYTFAELADMLKLVSNTIGTTEFIDQTSGFVDLGYGTFFEPGTPTLMNGNDATYTLGAVTIDPAADGMVTPAELFVLESMFHHYVDENNRGLFFFYAPEEDLSAFDIKDVFNTFNSSSLPPSNGSLIITGLPRISAGGGTGAGGAGGLANFNDIAPEAGDEEVAQNGEVAPQDIEPAAGEGTGNNGTDNAACWADASQTLGGGRAVQMNLGGAIGDLLNDAVKCGNAAETI